MKYLNRKSILLLSVAAIGYISSFYSYGPASSAGDRTGSPMGSYQTCNNGSGCHTSAGAFTPVVTVQLISGSTPVTSYVGGNSYTVRITLSSSTGVTSSTRYSFQIVAVQSSTNNNVTGWGTLPSGTHSATVSSRTYIEHTTQLTSSTINLPWTAPASSTGNITFYCAGNIVNYNYQETGDNCNTTSLTVTPATGGCTAPTLGTSVTNILCYGDSTGAVNLTTTGGTSPFLFQWSGPAGYQATTQNISNLKAGTYSVVVTASGGCTATASAVVTQPTTPFIPTAGSNSPVCLNGTLNMTGNATGGTGTLTYSWIGPGSFTSGNKNFSITPALATSGGQYILRVQDLNGCIVRDTENVVIKTKPTADSIQAINAYPGAYSFLAVNAQGVTTRAWDFADGSAIDTGATPFHVYTSTGAYSVRLILNNMCGSDTLYKQLYVAIAGINKATSQKIISVYPNPAHDYIIIRSDDVIKSISVYNMLGIKITETKTSAHETIVQTKGIPAGMYMLNVETLNANYIQRLQIE
ncbi:MAG: T9SS type A sorting domain-containing protein [Bacteroidetes bacterium]|nr:T9SS type A sorting domain-containing protein [Bacteroidota bacterium]